MEPVFFKKNLNGIFYDKGICPVAERLQPKIIQLKTNFDNENTIDYEVKVLKKTIKVLDERYNH